MQKITSHGMQNTKIVIKHGTKVWHTYISVIKIGRNQKKSPYYNVQPPLITNGWYEIKNPNYKICYSSNWA